MRVRRSPSLLPRGDTNRHGAERRHRLSKPLDALGAPGRVPGRCIGPCPRCRHEPRSPAPSNTGSRSDTACTPSTVRGGSIEPTSTTRRERSNRRGEDPPEHHLHRRRDRAAAATHADGLCPAARRRGLLAARSEGSWPLEADLGKSPMRLASWRGARGARGNRSCLWSVLEETRGQGRRVGPFGGSSTSSIVTVSHRRLCRAARDGPPRHFVFLDVLSAYDARYGASSPMLPTNCGRFSCPRSWRIAWTSPLWNHWW
jgi:hypothetical protein